MVSKICWHCGKDAHMARRRNAFSAKPSKPSIPSNIWFAVFTCDECGYAVLGKIFFKPISIFRQEYPLGDLPTSNSDIYIKYATEAFDSEDTDIEWLPQAALGKEYENVDNEIIEDSASEAHSCYSIQAYRAAILLSRSVVEAIAKDKGITDGNLKKKIAELESKQLISPLVRQQADEIRYFGNDMAHGDFTQPVKAEDAQEVLDFLDILIDAVYQQPAKLLAMKNLRERRKQKQKTQQQ